MAPRMIIASLVVLGGCMKPNPLLEQLAEADEAGDVGETGETGEMGADDDDDDDGGDGDGDDPHSFPDLPTDDGGEVCEPLVDYDPACGECLSSLCCELALDCAALEDCACLSACLLAGGGPGKCKNECGGVKAQDVPELQPLMACAEQDCGASC